MPSPLTREELEAHIVGLRDLINGRFDTMDDNFGRLNGRVGRTEERVTKAEKDLIRIKAYWTAGMVLLATAWQVVGDYIKGLLP